MKIKLALAAVVLAATYALLLWSGDRGAIAYYSPQTLEVCYRSERTIRGTGIPIYRSDLRCYTNELMSLLIEDGYITPQQDTEPDWLPYNHWNDSWKDGFSSLYRLFSLRRKQVTEWSRGNPEAAQVFWSEMFRHLRSDTPSDVTIGKSMAHCWREFEHPNEVRAAIADIVFELEHISP